MAVIKINRSQSKITNVPTPNISALRLDSNLALAQGNAIASIGKVIEDTAAKTKKQEDKINVRLEKAGKSLNEKLQNFINRAKDDANKQLRTLLVEKVKDGMNKKIKSPV